MLLSKRKGEWLLLCWREKQGINKWLKKKSEEGPNARKLETDSKEEKEGLWHRKTLTATSFCNGQGFEGMRTDSLPASVLGEDRILCLEWMWKCAILIQTLTWEWYYAPIRKLFHFRFAEIKSEVKMKIQRLWIRLPGLFHTLAQAHLIRRELVFLLFVSYKGSKNY